MLPSDAKSQNSDYGSFCHTPSDTFGNSQTTTGSGSGAETNGAGSPDHLDHGGGGGDGDGDGLEGHEGHEHPDHHQQGDTQSQPLLPPRSQSADEDTSSDDDAGANNAGYMRRKTKYHRSSAGAGGNNTSDALSETDSTMTESEDIKGEPLKTLLAGFFLIFAWVATTTSLALTHERLPEYNTSHDALPDLILDNIKYQSWGLDASEITIMICTWMAFLVTLFHKHRFIVLRRIFLLVGIHYYYRAVTMYITVLPKSNDLYKCAPKSDHVTFMIIFQRVLKLLSGMGLSINGKHVYCGDYIYSGHTMTLIMTYMVIKEYSPKRWFLLHWLSLGLTSFGVVALLLARGHYSIDVIIAYWITTRLWWMYHTMTKHDLLKSRENDENHLNKIWWWYIFLYFEGRVPIKLPREYGWPLPKKLLQWNVFRRRNLDQESIENLEAGLGSHRSQEEVEE
jgi:shingomyelin synthase